MANDSYGNLTLNGLWKNNIGLVQLLGLCPLLAVSSTVVNALGLGLATTLVLLASNASVSLIRNLVRPEIRIPAFMMIIASFVTAIDLAMQGWLFELHKVLGIFIPLIVTNCAIIGRAEAFASRHGPLPSLMDGFATGLGFCIPLVLLGALRALTGHGTLLAGAEMLLGKWGSYLTLTIIPEHPGFLLAMLPPGAFFGLALLIAARNALQTDKVKRPAQPVSNLSGDKLIGNSHET